MSIKKCFVVMPYGSRGEYTHEVEEADTVFRKIIKPAVKRYAPDAICERQIDKYETGNITSAIINDIAECDLCIVDITGANANVFLELGVRYALAKKGTILIHQETDAIPFDIKVYSSMSYRPVNTKHYRDKLLAVIQSLFASQRESDSLVFDSLRNYNVEYRSQENTSKSIDQKMTWNHYWGVIESVKETLRVGANEGRYRPDVIVGVSNGGASIADLLFTGVVFDGPRITLWADRRGEGTYFDDEVNKSLLSGLKSHLSSLDQKAPRILLVDDIIASGKTSAHAQKAICEAFPNAHFRFLPMFFRTKEHVEKIKDWKDNYLWYHQEFENRADELIDRHVSNFHLLPYGKDLRAS